MDFFCLQLGTRQEDTAELLEVFHLWQLQSALGNWEFRCDCKKLRRVTVISVCEFISVSNTGFLPGSKLNLICGAHNSENLNFKISATSAPRNRI